VKGRANLTGSTENSRCLCAEMNGHISVSTSACPRVCLCVHADRYSQAGSPFFSRKEPPGLRGAVPIPNALRSVQNFYCFIARGRFASSDEGRGVLSGLVAIFFNIKSSSSVMVNNSKSFSSIALYEE